MWKTDTTLKKEEILPKKKCNTERGDESTSDKNCIILWEKHFEEKCLGIQKIKSFICTVFPWIYTMYFKYIQMFCISQVFLILLLSFHVLFFMILSSTAELPYGQLVLQQKYLQWKRL